LSFLHEDEELLLSSSPVHEGVFGHENRFRVYQWSQALSIPFPTVVRVVMATSRGTQPNTRGTRRETQRGTQRGTRRTPPPPPSRFRKAPGAGGNGDETRGDGRLAKGVLLAAVGVAGTGIVAANNAIQGVVQDPLGILQSSLSVEVLNKSFDAALTLNKDKLKNVVSRTEDAIFSLDQTSLREFIIESSKAIGSKGDKEAVQRAVDSALQLAGTAKKNQVNQLLSASTSLALSADKGKGIDVAITALETSKAKDTGTVYRTVGAFGNLINDVYPPGQEILKSTLKTVSTMNPKLLEKATSTIGDTALTADPVLVRKAIDDVQLAVFSTKDASTLKTVKALEQALVSCEVKCDEASLAGLSTSVDELVRSIDPTLLQNATKSVLDAALSVDKKEAVKAAKSVLAATFSANPASLIATANKVLPLAITVLRVASSNAGSPAPTEIPADATTGVIISAIAPTVLVLLRALVKVEPRKAK